MAVWAGILLYLPANKRIEALAGKKQDCELYAKGALSGKTVKKPGQNE